MPAYSPRRLPSAVLRRVFTAGRGTSVCVMRRSPATHFIDIDDVHALRVLAPAAAGRGSSTLRLLSWMVAAVLLALVVCVLFMTAIVPVVPSPIHSNERLERL